MKFNVPSGMPDSSCRNLPKREKMYQMNTNYEPNGLKLYLNYQMPTKYTNFLMPMPSKIHHKCDFWYPKNIPSGNPVSHPLSLTRLQLKPSERKRKINSGFRSFSILIFSPRTLVATLVHQAHDSIKCGLENLKRSNRTIVSEKFRYNATSM
jgi:hypothetical protein